MLVLVGVMAQRAQKVGKEDVFHNLRNKILLTDKHGEGSSIPTLKRSVVDINPPYVATPKSAQPSKI